MRISAVSVFVLFVLLSVAVNALQLGWITRDEALAAVYPGAELEAQRVFLTVEQTNRAESLSGEELSTALVARYIARRGGTVIGRAYVDTHNVRTKPESLLISLNTAGQVKRIDVTVFLEPIEYQASERWFRQYQDQKLDDDLALQRKIRPIAGATLTVIAANEAVRRVLAIDQVLQSDTERQ